jgi:hypothetical protein
MKHLSKLDEYEGKARPTESQVGKYQRKSSEKNQQERIKN